MSADPLSTILDYSVTLADKTSFGQVTDGYIRIYGRLSAARFVASDAELEKHWDVSSQALRLRTDSSEIEAVVNPSIIPDTYRAIPEGKEGSPIFPLSHALGGTEFWLLPICLNPSACVGLVLKYTGTKGQYRRIGAFAQSKDCRKEFWTLLKHNPLLDDHGNVVITII
jgi:hypothetical protein